MVIPALLIGGGVLYVGRQVYQRRHKQSTKLVHLLHEEVEHHSSPHPTKRSLLPKVLIGAGIIVVGGALVIAANNGITPLLVTNRLIALLQKSAYGAPLFVAAYATLPLLLFPSTLLTIAAGLLFGPVQGILYTVIGSNISALAAYQIGRRLRRLGEEDKADETDETANPQATHDHLRIIEPFIHRLQDNPFATVLTMHCLFLPYEFVSYGAGLLGLPLGAFAPATTIGMLPWTFSFVLAGASVQSTMLTGFPSVDPAILVTSVAICAGSLALAGFINWRQSAPTKKFIAAPVAA